MRSEFDKTPHVVAFCNSLKPEHAYQLQRAQGECLVGAGLPEKSTLIINCTGVDPRPGDLVWVDNSIGTIHGFIKQVKSFENNELLVTTNYEDPSRNSEFYATTYYGVVEFAFDILGELCYKRKKRGEWISVDERLPEEKGDYLVYTERGTMMTMPFFTERNSSSAVYGRGFCTFEKGRRTNDDDWWKPVQYVTHWMPLPELPVKITCKDCKHLVFSDCYGECNKSLRIVNPDDTCEYAERKEQNNEQE